MATTRRARIDAGIFLLLTPVLWGATFPAGKRALETLPALSFMAWSRFLGFLAILATLPWLARGQITRGAIRRVAGPGLLLGCLMFASYNLQTTGLDRTTATNAGFITGLYVVLTPFLGLVLFRHPAGRAAWVSALISMLGLFLLSIPGLDEIRPRTGDLLVFASTLGWAAHVVAVGRLAPRHPATLLSLAQMGVAAALHLVAAAPVGLRPEAAGNAWGLLLITGILGSGLAWSIQVAAQREVTPARAAVILAGESVFAAAFSFVWLGERLEPHQWAGALVAVAAMVLSEVGARRTPAERLDPGTAL